MAYSLSPWLKPRFFITGTNRPLAGGLMYTYKAGTTDPATTYSDDAGTTNTNPIQLDSDGQCDLFLDDAVSYRIILKNSAGVTQFDKDRIASLGSTQVQSFNSIAALRLRSGTTIANAAKTLGYYSAGDGGGNSFYWDSTSVATDNGGTVIKPTAVSGAGRWLAVDTSYINVKQFGAVGDGVADDTAEIQAADNYAGPLGLPIVLPHAEYFLTKSAALSSSVIGNASKIIVAASSNFAVFDFVSPSGKSVCGLRFEVQGGGTVGNSCSALAVRGETDTITIEDVEAVGFNSGIYLAGNGSGSAKNASFEVLPSPTATGGTWAIGILPVTLGEPLWTAALAYNANTAAVQGALDAAIGAGNVTVTAGSGSSFLLTFGGAYTGLYVQTPLTKSTLTGATVDGVVASLIEQGGGPWIRNATLRNVKVSRSSVTWGMHFDYVDGLTLDGCCSVFNWLDGLKLRSHVRDVKVIGGNYDENGQGWKSGASQTAGDGMDTYAGGERLRVIGATFNRNAGSGIQIKNGFVTDSGYSSGKMGLSRKIDIIGIEASHNQVGNGVSIAVNEGSSSYIVSDVSVDGGLFEGNGYAGVLVNGVRVILNGVKARRNQQIGIAVGIYGRNVELNSCISVANGTGANTGYGALIDGKQVQVNGGTYVGVDSDSYTYATDPATLTKYHRNNISITLYAVDVHVKWPYEAHNNASGGRGISVNAAAVNAIVWQSPTEAGLVPGTSLLQGSPGSMVLKTDAVNPADRYWIKLAGGNADVGTWKRIGGLGVAAKSADYTALASDDVISVSTTGGARTVTLPTAVGNKGISMQVIRNSASANNLIVAAAGAETIAGASTKTLGAQWSTIKIVSDGANWLILSQDGTVT